MARMHKSKRGRSGSTPPVNKETPEWVDMDEEEMEDLLGSDYED